MIILVSLEFTPFVLRNALLITNFVCLAYRPRPGLPLSLLLPIPFYPGITFLPQHAAYSTQAAVWRQPSNTARMWALILKLRVIVIAQGGRGKRGSRDKIASGFAIDRLSVIQNQPFLSVSLSYYLYPDFPFHLIDKGMMN